MAARACWQPPEQQSACKGGSVSFPGLEQSWDAMVTSIMSALNNEDACLVNLAETFLAATGRAAGRGKPL